VGKSREHVKAAKRDTFGGVARLMIRADTERQIYWERRTMIYPTVNASQLATVPVGAADGRYCLARKAGNLVFPEQGTVLTPYCDVTFQGCPNRCLKSQYSFNINWPNGPLMPRRKQCLEFTYIQEPSDSHLS
jgi:hypothetical protein